MLGGTDMEPEHVEAVADALTGYLPKLRTLAARVAEIRTRPLPDQGEPTAPGIPVAVDNDVDP